MSQKNKPKTKLLSLILLVIIFLNLFYFILKNRNSFLSVFDTRYWGERYQRSQWAKGYEATELMGDAELYAYAGWRQVKGDDPTEINAEVPPLGRYLLGFSILIFGNQNIISPILGIILLWITYLISREILGKTNWALLPILLLSLDKLFKENLTTSMLDLPLAVFMALAFYFLIKARENRRLYPAVAVCLAAISATKMYLLGFALTATIGLYLLFCLIVFHLPDIFWFFASLPIFILAYCGFYIVYFINGNNLLDFKYLHFWIRHFAWVRVDNYPKGEIFKILLFGRWLTWWEGLKQIKVNQWNIFWPVSFLGSLFITPQSLIKKDYPLLVLLLWIFSSLAVFSVGVPYPRYLLPILLPLYILLTYNTKKLILIFRNGKN